MPVPENIKLGDNAGGINHCSDATWSCNESSGDNFNNLSRNWCKSFVLLYKEKISLK